MAISRGNAGGEARLGMPQFSIRSLLMATLGIAGVLGVSHGELSPVIAGSLWLIAGGSWGAFDFGGQRGVGRLRGPIFGGAFGGALAGLAWAALAAVVSHWQPYRNLLVPTVPGSQANLTFLAYFWVASGAWLGGVLGLLVGGRQQPIARWDAPNAEAEPTPAFEAFPPLDISASTGRGHWRQTLRSVWFVVPCWMASAHCHILLALGLGFVGWSIGEDPRLAPRRLEPILVTWTPSELGDSTSRSQESEQGDEGQALLPLAPPIKPVGRKAGHTIATSTNWEDRRGDGGNDRKHSNERPQVAPTGTGLARVHVVGLYEGQGKTKSPLSEHPIGDAEVHVTYAAGPIVLVLCAYDPVLWKVRITSGAEVERVIVSGYHTQQVEGLPARIPVEIHSYETKSRNIFFCYKRDTERFPWVAKSVESMTGMEIATFQGAYDYSGKPFIIGPESQAWTTEYERFLNRDARRAKEIQRQMQGRAELGDVRFSGMWRVRNGHDTLAYYGDLTLDGPTARVTKLERDYNGMAISPDGRGYAVYMHEAYELTPTLGLGKKLPLPKSLPELSWPCSAAFDSKRGRFLAGTLGGEGHLYAYDIETRQWSLLTNLRNVDVIGMVYSEEDDLIYAVNDDNNMELFHRSPVDGTVLKRIRLGKPIALRQHGGPPQLYLLSGGRLVLVGPAIHHVDARGLPKHYPATVLERSTGAILWKGEIPAESVDASD